MKASVGRGLNVLVIHGARDAIVPVANSRRLVTRLRASAHLKSTVRLIEFDASGHLPHEEEPGAFVDAVTAFVAQAEV